MNWKVQEVKKPKIHFLVTESQHNKIFAGKTIRKTENLRRKPIQILHFPQVKLKSNLTSRFKKKTEARSDFVLMNFLLRRILTLHAEQKIHNSFMIYDPIHLSVSPQVCVFSLSLATSSATKNQATQKRFNASLRTTRSTLICMKKST